MRLIVEIAAACWESVRETWPTDEHEAGIWLAGFCWAFAVFWTCLFAVTWLYFTARGIRP